MSFTLDRRTALRGMVNGMAVAVGLPLLDIFLDGNGTAMAATGAPMPIRFGTWFWGLGVNPPRWFPSTAGKDYELKVELASIEALKHKVNILYTAPTAIRAMMAQGDAAVVGADGSSLRLLGSVGEPINPEAWNWYYKTVGKERCPIVDTWWQTETGGILISPLPGATALKPGSATRPFFGVQPALVDNLGNLIEGAAEGNLVIIDSWPGQARTLYGDHDRFVDTYFKTFKGMYFTGDGARRDEDGYYWITGRVDDVLNVSGHRMGTAEIESAMVAHPKVAEAAVVGVPHDIKGQGIYVYVTLNGGEQPSEQLRQELKNWVRKEIGPIASPDVIQWAPGLPKTRSGKIMRRILRKIATAEYDALGDISTLADPGVVQHLIDTHREMQAA